MTNSFTHNATGGTGRHPLTRELIGSCGVDSARLVVVDPSYLRIKRLMTECSDVGTGGVLPNPNGETLAVTVDNFGGDGVFPVYAVVDNTTGETVRLEVDLSRGGNGRLEPGPVTSSSTRPTLRPVSGDETAFGPRFDPTIGEMLVGDEPDVEKLARIVETAVMRLIDETDPKAFMPEHYEKTAERMAVLIERVALCVLTEPTPDEDTEASVLDGERGIASRLQPMPDGFVEWAHERIVELLAVARESDRWMSGDHVPAESRATFMQTTAMRSAGFRPHFDPTVRVLRDEQIEHALHDLLDALVHGWQIAQLNRQSRIDETMAVACLRSVTT